MLWFDNMVGEKKVVSFFIFSYFPTKIIIKKKAAMNITYHTNYFLILINYHLYRDSFIKLARYAYKDTNYQLSHQLISNIHLSFKFFRVDLIDSSSGAVFSFFFDFKTLGKKKKFLQLNCSLVQESVNEVKLVVFSSFYVPNNNIYYGTIQCIKNAIIILITIIF